MFPTAEYVRELENALAYYRYLHWIRYEFLSFPWILLTVITILAAFVWVKLVDRNKLFELLLFGSWVAIVGVSADEFGYEYRLWRYNFHVIPQFPHITWVHYVILPIIYMLIYQYFPTWKSFIKAIIIAAAIFGFVGEPILVKLHFYELLKWNYCYSIPLYVLMGIALKGLVEWIKTLQTK